MVPLVPVFNFVPGANYPESNGHNILSHKHVPAPFR